MKTETLLKEAEDLYDALRMAYLNPIPDKTGPDGAQRLLDQTAYYKRGVNTAEECLKVLERHENEKAIALFCLVLALEGGHTRTIIERKFRLAIKKLPASYKPKLAEIIRSKFWELPLGEVRLRPYDPDLE